MFSVTSQQTFLKDQPRCDAGRVESLFHTHHCNLLHLHTLYFVPLEVVEIKFCMREVFNAPYD